MISLHTLLINAHLFAPEDLGLRCVLVAAGKIVWIGECEPQLGDLETERIDLEGRRVIPGLIDPHVHVTGGGGEAGAASGVPRLLLHELTRAGVTSVVGLLGTDDLTRSPQSLLTAVRGLADQGLGAWCYTGGYHFPPVTITGSVRSDIVFIDRMIGVGELALSDHRSSQPTEAELLRVAADTHVAGLMTGKAGVVHLHMGDGRRGLDLVRSCLDHSELPARTFYPTHVNRRGYLFDEAMALADRGCTIDITAFPPSAEISAAPRTPTEASASTEDELNADDALLRYLDAGLDPRRVTLSSDGGGCLPRFDQDLRVASFDVGQPSTLALILRRLLDRGASLERILPAFCTNAAELLRLSQKGRIEVGRDADLVVLGGEDLGADEPLIRDVMIGGRWHLARGASQIRDLFGAARNSPIPAGDQSD